MRVRVRFAGGADPDGPDPEGTRPLGPEILRLVIEAFRGGRATPRPDQLAVWLGVEAGRVQAAIDPLLRSGILVDPEGRIRGFFTGTTEEGCAATYAGLQQLLELESRL